MNALLLKLIKENKGKFRCSFSITGIAVEQFRAYAPEVLDSFKELAATGCVEFLAETYSHSLASLASKEDFTEQVRLHTNLMKKEFGVKPTAFRNTELIYSDDIGAMVASMGFRTMLAEGAKHVLGWKSPNYVYANAIDQKLRLLLRNYKLSDDIAFRFSNKNWDEWPLTAEKYVQWLASDETPGEVINLFMDYETFGEHQTADTGIFEFMRALPKAILAKKNGLEFATVTEAAKKYQPVAVLHCPHVMSWADEERDVTAWLGNELFQHFTLPKKTETTPRALSRESFEKIRDVEIPAYRKSHMLARDMFLFGCYTGVSYADVVSITHANLQTDGDGALWLKYRRKKNELRASVKLLPEAIALINKYSSEDRETLFPLLRWPNLRRHMKALAALAGIKDDLCYHQARHSFASLITLEAGVPIETISRMLGHSDISTTQVYARVSPKKLFEDMDRFIKATEDFKLTL